MDNKRITILDGLRVIAIIMVMLFHFYYRFLNVYYQYSFKVSEIFKYGYLGVELFFIISGFVITLTLTKCHSFLEFIKKRFIRLIPGMLICSVFTFFFINLIDSNNIFADSKSFSNLFISNTFISPNLINLVFNSKTSYIDGAYWSLWAEISFYMIAGFLYFISKDNLLRNFSIIAFIGVIGFFLSISATGMNIISPVIGSGLYLKIREFFKIVTFFEYGLWFLLGMVLNKLYFKKENKWLLLYFTFIFIVQILLNFNFYVIIFSLISYFILLCFIYKPTFVSIFANKNFAKVGVASYSIYLIHQNIGVVVINKFSYLFGSFNWVIPILLIVVFIMFGIVSYKYLESPLSLKLKTFFFRK